MYILFPHYSGNERDQIVPTRASARGWLGRGCGHRRAPHLASCLPPSSTTSMANYWRNPVPGQSMRLPYGDFYMSWGPEGFTLPRGGPNLAQAPAPPYQPHAPPPAQGIPVGPAHAVMPNTGLAPARLPAQQTGSLAPADPTTYRNFNAATPAAPGPQPNHGADVSTSPVYCDWAWTDVDLAARPRSRGRAVRSLRRRGRARAPGKRCRARARARRSLESTIARSACDCRHRAPGCSCCSNPPGQRGRWGRPGAPVACRAAAATR